MEFVGFGGVGTFYRSLMEFGGFVGFGGIGGVSGVGAVG